MEAKMEVATWEEVEGESLVKYLAKVKLLIIEKKFSIYQMTD